MGVFLVHNAGIATPALLTDISEETWDKHYLTHLKAPLFLTQSLLPHLINGGRVLNISSGLAHNALPAMGAYGISKSALFMMKAYFNAELNNQHILFGSAMPGVVNTPIQTNLRTYNKNTFPAVDTFQGFFQRRELLSAQTAAKFLTWLLLDTSAEQFIQGDWDIYNTTHHKHWAKPDDVVQREKTNQEISNAQSNTTKKEETKPTNYLFYLIGVTSILIAILNILPTLSHETTSESQNLAP